MKYLSELEVKWLAASCVTPTETSNDTWQVQPFEYFVVFDLAGQEEIIEFPVIVVDATTLNEVGRFHRWIRPVQLFEGMPLNPASTAIPFVTALQQFEEWLSGVIPKDKTFSFVICGDWDLKTQIPKQCSISNCSVPTYMHRWINLKDVFTHFYERKVHGMKEMLQRLHMLDSQGQVEGFHHLGMHDTENIAKILVRVIQDGAVVSTTAVREEGKVRLLFGRRAGK